MTTTFGWAQEVFGSLEIPALLRRRVVSMAATALKSPDGTITKTFSKPSERQGAYRALSNPVLTQTAIAEAAAAAAARRANGHRVVFVPVDASSLSVADPRRAKGTGPVDTDDGPGRGFHAISAVLVIAGVVAGLLAQHYWNEPDKKKRRQRDLAAVREEEAARWCAVLDSVLAIFAKHAPGCVPWFQLDFGGDVQPVLEHASEHKCMLTVRSLHDRKMANGELLHTMIRRETVVATMTSAIGTSQRARARDVTFDLRFKRVTLKFRDRLGQEQHRDMELTVVHVVERDAPIREEPIEWFLLTTRAVKTEADASAVVDAYAQRIHSELMHHGWKSGLCNVERTQLRSAEGMQKWATIMAAVATETLFRARPPRVRRRAPAAEHLSPAQIDTVSDQVQPKG